ncbi:MAG: hypoxanthine phosphoribosyltransferase [Clostridia bacterium]|jgi:hypoxanthine phosphoribosyltransferase|nr:hypoxanthine phosphoribosyltransferase [Clostridia bacterium]
MHKDIERILITEEELEQKVQEMGEQISKDYVGKDLLLVGILKGAVVFLSDLMRKISIPLHLDFMAVSSYGQATESSGAVMILKDLETNISEKHVLIVEDIVDTGLTLKYIVENLKSRNPLSLKVCTLLDKPERRLVDVQVDYKGFSIPDAFVVGYGLDYGEQYRHLPHISVLKPEVYQK